MIQTCRALGYRRPTPVQRQLIPFLLQSSNNRQPVLALAATGTGKTAAVLLPLLHHLAPDPYGVFAVIVTPTRELARQIHQQCLALGSAYRVVSVLVVGGLDGVRQANQLAHSPNPHFVVATPGRLAALLRGPPPRPRLRHCRYLVLDEADRLLAADGNCGFERDVAELLLHTTRQAPGNFANNNSSSSTSTRSVGCQTIMLSATMTASLTAIEELACGGAAAGQQQGGRLPLRKFIVRQDGDDNDGNNSNSNKEEDSNKKKKKQRKTERTSHRQYGQ